MWPFSKRKERKRIDRAIEDLRERIPFIDDLWVLASMTRVRTEMLRAKLRIPPVGRKHQQLTAFYLGAVEGDVRKRIDMSEITLGELGRVGLGVALYTAQKDRVISLDDEWVSLATEYQQFYMDPDNHDFRILGIKYSGMQNHDPESAWGELEKQLSQ